MVGPADALIVGALAPLVVVLLWEVAHWTRVGVAGLREYRANRPPRPRPRHARGRRLLRQMEGAR